MGLEVVILCTIYEVLNMFHVLGVVSHQVVFVMEGGMCSSQIVCDPLQAGSSDPFVELARSLEVFIECYSSAEFMWFTSYDVPQEGHLSIQNDVSYQFGGFVVLSFELLINPELFSSNIFTFRVVQVQVHLINYIFVTYPRVITMLNVEDIPRSSHVESV